MNMSYRLTPKQYEVLTLLAQGHRRLEICNIMHISPCTLDTHVAMMYQNLGWETGERTHARLVKFFYENRVNIVNRVKHGGERSLNLKNCDKKLKIDLIKKLLKQLLPADYVAVKTGVSLSRVRASDRSIQTKHLFKYLKPNGIVILQSSIRD